jgi:pseudouridylate synthase
MTWPNWLRLHPDVAAALERNVPVVALESTLIAHGLPWPTNLETALEAEAAVRESGAVPATIAVWEGQPTIGLAEAQLTALAQSRGILKASRRDLAIAVAQNRSAATTVAATMYLAHQAGISVFATGGIGGAHPESANLWDISADLVELARIPLLVVCAGAKSILDLPRTLEILETLSVPVLGYQTQRFPAFYLRDSSLALPARVDTPEEAALVFRAHRRMGNAGVLLTLPISAEAALSEGEFNTALKSAEREAQSRGIRGSGLTPFLLSELARLTEGRSLRANRALIIANARLAGQVALALGR